MALTGHTERMKMRSGANGRSIFGYLHMSPKVFDNRSKSPNRHLTFRRTKAKDAPNCRGKPNISVTSRRFLKQSAKKAGPVFLSPDVLNFGMLHYSAIRAAVGLGIVLR
jgi:hypothetical protein